MTDSALDREKCKSPDNALAFRLLDEVGWNPAETRVALDLIAEHITTYYKKARGPNVIVYSAVAVGEPAGKPIKHCKLTPVELAIIDDADGEVLRKEGSVQLRRIRLLRLAMQARQQGGLLSYEDLAVLLGLDLSTVGDLASYWKQKDIPVPTRGAIEDIGREPSHKRLIAGLLGRGYTTSSIRASTSHSEGAIARYQHDFALVLSLLDTYPEATEDQLCQLSGLSLAVFCVYRKVAEELREKEDCLPHLERLRRRFELDPEGLAFKPPPGKAPVDLAEKRLEQQTLVSALRQTIQEDLDTTRRVAETVAGDLMKIVDQSFALSDALRPGEVVTLVDAQQARYISGERVEDRSVVPVRLPLYTEQTLEIWRSEVSRSEARARIAALLATSAQEQGAVMSISKLAELLHVQTSTLAGGLRDLAIKTGSIAPTKGLIEDAGGTLTHKDWIVDLDQFGLTGAEISWLTRHAPISRDRYIETYRRAEILMRLDGCIPNVDKLSRTLGLRPHVARQYVELLHKYHTPESSQEQPNLPPSVSTAAQGTDGGVP